MRRKSYFFIRLLSTALVVTVPLLAIHAWTLVHDLREAQQNAYQEVREKSASAARTVAAALDDAERLLTFIAGHSEIRSLDPFRCREFLRGLQAIDPLHAVVSVLDLSGQAYCISIPGSGGSPPSAGNSDWFTRATSAQSFFLGKPAMGRITGKAVAPLSLAVRDLDGERVAIAVVSFDLKQLEGAMVGEWSAPDGVLALVNQEFQFLVRSPDTLKWMGLSASNAVKEMRPTSPDGVVEAVGVDGVQRIFSASTVPKYQLRVVASIPSEQVLAGPYGQIRHALIVACAALVLAGLLAYYGARALVRPVRSLAGTARGFAAGVEGTRADESLPGEFKHLAVEMNSMHAARKESEAKARASENGLRRLSRFFEAKSRANQAIVRLGTASALYDAICQICVDTGQASMAWVGVIEDYRLIPIAWGGPAQQYTQAFELDLRPLALPAGGAFGASVMSGQARVVNDYVNDPRTAAFRDNAAPFGVRASAIVPFSSAGVVVGTLNLYASEPGFFDEPLMRLLVEMAEDVSFALDNYERAAVHARTSAELAKRESQLSGIVESAMDAIITIDESQCMLVFNDAAARVFKLPVEQAIGQTLGSLIPMRHRAANDRDVAMYLERDSESPGPIAPRHLTGLRSDGVEFPMEVSTSRTHDDADVLITMMIRDVTGEREAEQARLAAAASNAANRAKTEFLSRMSHELRTPLNAVLGFSQLLQESARGKLNELERRQLDLVFLAGAQLRALVDDVLDVSVIESGQLTLSSGKFELTTLLDSVARMSEPAAAQGGVELVATYGTLGPLDMRADANRLRQVLLNLVSNAIKYSHPRDSVAIGVEAVQDAVRISVADTGMGMTEQQLAGLFEPFNRLGRENSAIAGTGIGMALVRQLVQLMGGSLSVRSEAGVGTTVEVELPRALGTDDLESSRALEFRVSERVALDSEPCGLVLYIEDNPVNVLVVKSLLRRWPGVQLVIAEDGASGIRQAMAIRPDVVLLDMRLPDMSGLQVLEALRADVTTRCLRVIALSASAMPDEVRSAKDAGAQDYWTKPIDVVSFCAGMTRLLSETPISSPRVAKPT